MSYVIPPARRAIAGGFGALPLLEQHELRSGVQHVTRLGERAWCELLVEIVQDECDLDEVLARLQSWRQRLSPEIVRAVGADRMPSRCLRVVPSP